MKLRGVGGEGNLVSCELDCDKDWFGFGGVEAHQVLVIEGSLHSIICWVPGKFKVKDLEMIALRCHVF